MPYTFRPYVNPAGNYQYRHHSVCRPLLIEGGKPTLRKVNPHTLPVNLIGLSFYKERANSVAHSLRTTIVAISHGTMRHHLIIQAPMDRAMDVNLGDHTSSTNPPPPSGQRRGKRMHRGVRLIARRTPHNYIPPCHFPSPLGQQRGRNSQRG